MRFTTASKRKNNNKLKYVESFDMTKLLHGKSVEKNVLKEVSFLFKYRYNSIKIFKQSGHQRL